jgi:hypothetical protein
MTACLGCGSVSGSITSCDSATALALRSARAIAVKFLGRPATSSPICQISASGSSSIQNTEVWRSLGDGINADGLALFLVKSLALKINRERIVYCQTRSTSNVLPLSRRLRNTSNNLLRTRLRKLLDPMNFALFSESSRVGDSAGSTYTHGEHLASRTEPIE